MVWERFAGLLVENGEATGEAEEAVKRSEMMFLFATSGWVGVKRGHFFDWIANTCFTLDQ